MRSWPIAVAAALAVAVAAGCGGEPEAVSGAPITMPPAASAPSASSDAAAGPVYRLSGNLCGIADQAPLKELFPVDGSKPLVDTPQLCATSRLSQTMTVSLSIDAQLMPSERTARLYLDTDRRKASHPATDIAGAGSAAFWAGDQHSVKLTSFHGNLVLEIEVTSVSDKNPLPAGVPERLVRVAAGTFAKLAP